MGVIVYDASALTNRTRVVKEADHLATMREKDAEIERLRHLNLCTFCAYCGEFFEADADGKRTVAVTEHIHQCLKHPMRAAERHVEAVEEQNNQLKTEIERLKQWKIESLEVEASWDCQGVGKAIGVQLGSNIRKEILPYILKTKVEIERLTLGLKRVLNFPFCEDGCVDCEVLIKAEAEEALKEKT
jgi:hypothetical protein